MALKEHIMNIIPTIVLGISIISIFSAVIPIVFFNPKNKHILALLGIAAIYMLLILSHREEIRTALFN